MIRRLVALFLLLCASPAVASSYVGTLPFDNYVAVPIPAGPGTYRLSFAFSKPVLFDVTIFTEEHYNFFFVDSGEYIGGDDSYYLDTHTYLTPTNAGFMEWTIDGPYSYVFSDILTIGFYNGVNASFNFYNDYYIPATYYISITAVPEPAHWALLIFGLGLAGAALRRRARAMPRLMPAA